MSPVPSVSPVPTVSPVPSVSPMSSVSSAGPWILLTAVACSVVLAAGPVSAWTHRYIRRPLVDDEPESDEDVSQARSLEPRPPVYPTLRHSAKDRKSVV